ncbi:unnamed protein product [Amoebophrya sp. A120]|nr:unnamed protein product [Amoebophrya sp. A120]|eukprot:GSA120T00017784001.1
MAHHRPEAYIGAAERASQVVTLDLSKPPSAPSVVPAPGLTMGNKKKFVVSRKALEEEMRAVQWAASPREEELELAMVGAGAGPHAEGEAAFWEEDAGEDYGVSRPGRTTEPRGGRKSSRTKKNKGRRGSALKAQSREHAAATYHGDEQEDFYWAAAEVSGATDSQYQDWGDEVEGWGGPSPGTYVASKTIRGASGRTPREKMPSARGQKKEKPRKQGASSRV